MADNDREQWDIIFDNKPLAGWMALLFLIASIVAIPVAVAVVFNVSAWVPITTMLLGWAANILSALWRNYLVMKVMIEKVDHK